MAGRRNILWIITTQWRAQSCGYAGDPNARTPGLDSLAAGSADFSQAVTPHPFGPFARAAMLTGVPSPQNGVCDYFDPLPAGTRTIAHALASQGYETAFFGKWHLGRRNPAAPLVGEEHARIVVPPGERGGFGFWEGFESGFLLNDPWLHGTRLPEPVRIEGYQADVVCRQAAQWVGNKRPFFCVVSLEAPHPPYDAPAAGVERRDPRDIILPANVPRGGPIEEKARRELAGYHAHIEATDRAIGGLLAEKIGDEAVIVFTSVHGDMHGAHGLFRKGWPYEESVRVPLLVRIPRGGMEVGGRRWEAGGRSNAPVSLLDLPRWTLAWAGGNSQPPVFAAATARAKTATSVAAFSGKGGPGTTSGYELGKPASISMPCVVRQPHQCDRPWHGVRTPARKLVLNPDGTPWLFFDLEKDPLEMNNLAGNPAHAGEIDSVRLNLPPGSSSRL